VAYLYLKKKQSKIRRSRVTPKNKKIISGLLFLLGVYVFASAIFPIIKFQIEYSFRFNQIVSPLSSRFYNQGSSILGDLTTDYTQLNNWFVNQPEISHDSDSPSGILASAAPISYTISIPKLKISDAIVIIGSTDLKKSLIQYPQTALPGALGNAVVFGHSVLPQFFNPKSYLTIFSTLYKLKPGDDILVNYDKVTYKYLVQDMYEVQPTDLSVLEQHFDARYMTIITCSPPGTYLRRLVIKTRIVDI
jgi:sortase A